jgi:hypothetical protein
MNKKVEEEEERLQEEESNIRQNDDRVQQCCNNLRLVKLDETKQMCTNFYVEPTHLPFVDKHDKVNICGFFLWKQESHYVNGGYKCTFVLSVYCTTVTSIFNTSRRQGMHVQWIW